MASRVSSQKAQSWKAVKAKKNIRNPETIDKDWATSKTSRGLGQIP